ncbi:MAG TPA: NAD(P)-dependent oxidoreductase [Candidatus Dormibacteraeota bacterium]|nr:NAD(P)-dependent oxidoreductase [Candidatus Dormibacteraeota bacterium]
MRVGFIGLGQMGSPIAMNLLRAGHELTVYNRSAAKAHAHVQLGAQQAGRIADACHGQVVITMLADDSAVSEVVFGDERMLGMLPRGAIHVSMSTISVALAKRLNEAHTRAAQRFVSAPVFGRPEAAAAAKLFIVAAGDPTAIDECEPLFDVIGQRAFPFGADPSIANLIELSGNFLIASTIEALGEAVALIAKAGVDRKAFVELLTSTLFRGPLYEVYGGLIASGRFEPAGFAAPLGHKDIRLAMAAAATLRVPMPLASLLNDRFLRLLAQGREQADWSAISSLAAADAAVPP